MKITAQEEYGLRCVMQLALNEGGHPLTIPEVAGREGISTAYVGKLMRLLRRKRLVASVRGREGGYVLARPRDQIAVGEVLAALGDPLFSQLYCGRYHGEQRSCVHLDGCSIRSVWGHLDALIARVLQSTTLAALVCGEPEVQHTLRTRWPLVAPESRAPSVALPR